MNFIIENKGKDSQGNLARKIGYFQHETEPDKISFIKPLERSGYPRFHLYIQETKDGLSFSLHLDQKRPIYQGSHAHAGEYEGAVVEKEAERIKKVLS